ncbi:ABC transporter aliphatic sulfonates-binding protein SsuA [Gottschalkia acidurici 9a]|uniref:ABC transporter aliphatic sulfonates-binding protein SsuA n=1 Tax=Gottschalkia acidurici (strain ATCC 7906 / DSM 604 / BCRC 14475 / CIP 104303 / KCTC 5404 / NCIMB 10678 / 9a) TaxID=1128398 RepID=K0AYG4_GOTA9|nr:ABC transporter substrate-binding protein [Gottschalkia acidurici]AFS77790.1 ABC transporter aliphatic sulfonates-binding protein SsuA [Gottschalkia acidurici 9a]
MIKNFLSFILVVLIGISITACEKKQEASKETTKASTEVKGEKLVRLGFPGSQNFLGGVAGIAQEKKFFDEELKKVGYKIEYVPFAAAGPAVNEALAGKQIDFAIYADFPGVVLKSKGIDIDLLGITDNKIHSTIVIKNDSKISSIKDLKGKKIGFTKGTYMQKFLIEILDKNGLTTNDVELINVTTDAESALITGNIDALVQTDTQALQLTVTKKIAKELDSTRNYPELSAQSVFVGDHKFAKDNPEVPVAIQKALVKAREYFKNNTEDSYKILTKSGLDLEAIKKQYDSESPEFEIFTLDITQDSIKRLDETQKYLIDQELITNKFDTEKWSDNSYYEKAIK